MRPSALQAEPLALGLGEGFGERLRDLRSARNQDGTEYVISGPSRQRLSPPGFAAPEAHPTPGTNRDDGTGGGRPDVGSERGPTACRRGAWWGSGQNHPYRQRPLPRHPLPGAHNLTREAEVTGGVCLYLVTRPGGHEDASGAKHTPPVTSAPNILHQ